MKRLAVLLVLLLCLASAALAQDKDVPPGGNMPGWEYLAAQGVFCVMFCGYFWYTQRAQAVERQRTEEMAKEERQYQRDKEKEDRDKMWAMVSEYMTITKETVPILQKVADQLDANIAISSRIEEKVNSCDIRRSVAA